MTLSRIGPDWTVQDLLAAMAARGPAPALVSFVGEQAHTVSCGELADNAYRLAGRLLQAGVEAGAMIGVYAPNSVGWLTVRLAAGAVGAVTVALDDLTSEAEATQLLGECPWLFTTRAHASALAAAAALSETAVYTLDEATPAPAGARTAQSWRSLVAQPATALPALEPAAPTTLVLTSGTTGAPKAFTLTHANLAANVGALAEERLIGADDRVLLPLPLHHIYPLVVGMLTSLVCGATLILPESLTGPRIVHALRAGRATAMVGVPRLYTALLTNLEDRVAATGAPARLAFRGALALVAAVERVTGLRAGRWVFRPLHRRLAPDLRMLACGGARLEPAAAQRLETLGWRVYTGYGLAETAAIFTANLPGRHRIGSEGRPLPGHQLRIAAPGPDGVGEIELRGDSVFSGYHDNPTANEAAFTADGWFRTGDIGRLDADGYLFVTGRSKDMIVLGGGKNVFPEDLEQSYGAAPVVAEVAVLEEEGRLVALVRPDVEAVRAGGTLSVEEAVRVALAEAGQQLPSYARLAGYALTNQPLPRTRLGKYRRFLLPDLYEQARRGAPSAPAGPLNAEDQALIALPVAGAVWHWLRERYRDRTITPSTSLPLDLGIDSLEWLRLSLTLSERFGIELGETEIADMATVRDLLQRVAHQGAQTQAAARVPVTRDPFRYIAPAGPLLTLCSIAIYALVWCVIRLCFGLRARGVEHVPPSGPAVIVANHASYLDAFVIVAALSARRVRHTFWGGAVPVLFQSRLTRLFCRAAHVFPIDERTPKTTLDIGGAILAHGDALMWFPEAWRTPTGELQAFRTGIGSVLAAHPAPVVAAYIEGTYAALPRTRRWPRLLPLAVTFAPPVGVDDLAHEGAGDSDEVRIANALHDRVAALANARTSPIP